MEGVVVLLILPRLRPSHLKQLLSLLRLRGDVESWMRAEGLGEVGLGSMFFFGEGLDGCWLLVVFLGVEVELCRTRLPIFLIVFV